MVGLEDNATMNFPVRKTKVSVIIPCFRVRQQILSVIEEIGPEVDHIFVVDDCCPQQSGRFVEESVIDPRVVVLFHDVNKGVGGAVITGYRAAHALDSDIMVKLDGDGQMDPSIIPALIWPLQDGRADYAKGNRFHSISNTRKMPAARLLGNAVLSFLTKMSSGYWSIFDPTNGFTALHATSFTMLKFDNISERYFFESDMLINLGDIRAVIVDVPMEASYADEESNLKIKNVAGEFLIKNIFEFFRRIFYTYFLRSFSFASINLIFGTALLVFGTIFGLVKWNQSFQSGDIASTGTVMVAALPIILGFQLLLNFLSFDMGAEPRTPLQRSHPPKLSSKRRADPDRPVL